MFIYFPFFGLIKQPDQRANHIIRSIGARVQKFRYRGLVFCFLWIWMEHSIV